MFFFIGGVEPRSTVIDEGPYRCPACDRATARIVRLDQYMSFFFIPVFPIKRGEPILACEYCGYTEDAEQARQRDHLFSGNDERERCPSCSTLVEKTYNYCPSCGLRLR